MRILCVLGKWAYGNADRGEGYEYSNIMPAFRNLGHEVLFLENWNANNYGNFNNLNKNLLRIVEEKRPDFVFSALIHYEIWLETLEIIRDSGIAAMVNWATDDSWKYYQFSRFIANAFHAFTTTDAKAIQKYQHDRIYQVLLTQWAANSNNLRKPLRGAECKYPVSFVGSAYGKRGKWIEELRKRGIDVECFGHGWRNGPINAGKIPEIMRNSVISLNFSSSYRYLERIRRLQKNQIKARVFEVPGNGGFLLTENADGIEQYYVPDREIVIFKGVDECAEKINYYLNNQAERNLIALAGYERTKKDHTYDQRLAEVIKFTIEQKEKYFVFRGVKKSGQIDWHKFESAAKRHVMDRKLLVLKNIMTSFCSMILGPVRGPRAARRLLFEISWRFVGAYTYSAAGWPGRCFDGIKRR